MTKANASERAKPADYRRIRAAIAERTTPGIMALFVTTVFALVWADPISRSLLGLLWILLALLVSIAETSIGGRSCDPSS